MVNNIGLKKQRHRPHIPSSEMKHKILMNLDNNSRIEFAYQLIGIIIIVFEIKPININLVPFQKEIQISKCFDSTHNA